MNDERKYCTFWLAEQLYGLDVQNVQEVLGRQPMTPVPLTPRAIRGLINLRGQIVAVLDLRRELDLPEHEGSMNIVVAGEQGPVSFLVDRVGDVLTVPDEAFESIPETLTGAARELIVGVYKLEGRLLHVLDPKRVIDLVDTEATLPGTR
jgi:purine-binding chemotaxis protein CheW